jgi:hypothetical protein
VPKNLTAYNSPPAGPPVSVVSSPSEKLKQDAGNTAHLWGIFLNVGLAILQVALVGIGGRFWNALADIGSEHGYLPEM